MSALTEEPTALRTGAKRNQLEQIKRFTTVT
jgi:hypothetical protein